MKQILAFGDSNTWGLVPGTAERYPEHIRWTGILRKAVANLGFRILEDGVCGRTTVFQDPSRSGRRGIESLSQYKEADGIDAAILMLGTNDCKKAYRATPEQIGCGLEQCLLKLEALVPPEKILVISPILLGREVWRPEKDPAFDRISVETSAALRAVYQSIAQRRGNRFLAASDHAAACHVDDEHLNAEGHEHLASAILKALSETGILAA